MDPTTPKLTPFRGRLDATQVAGGINAAVRNARRLAQDARLLIEAERYPTAASLAALAIEEVGKVQLLRRLSVAPDEAAAKAVWREIRSHRAKNGLWGIFEVARAGAVQLGQMAHLIDPDAEHAQLLDSLKQLGLYSDCYGAAHWSEPSDVVAADLARMLVAMALSLSARPEVSVRDLELWVLHVGPAGDDPDRMRAAVAAWHAAMVQEGLSNRDQDQFEAFLRGEAVSEPWGFSDELAAEPG